MRVVSANVATRLAAVAIILLGNGGYLTLFPWRLQHPRPRPLYARNRPIMEIGFSVLFMGFGARLVGREVAAWLWIMLGQTSMPQALFASGQGEPLPARACHESPSTQTVASPLKFGCER